MFTSRKVNSHQETHIILFDDDFQNTHKTLEYIVSLLQL